MRKRLKLIGIIFFIIISINIVNYFKSINDHINLADLDMKFYIENADEVSKGRLQVNWKYLAAIDGVRYKKDFSKASKESLISLGYMFTEEQDLLDSNKKYRLKNLDEVLAELEFENKEKERVYKYLEDLKHAGLVSSRLKEDSKYIKFINEISTEAIDTYNQYKILPSIIIAQAILESGWGESELSKEANNLFGIKADKSWNGKTISMNTSEFYNKNTTAKFRMYEDKSESLKNHGEFIYENKRYKNNGVFDASYYIEQAQALEDAGYSTKENENGERIYADLLIDLIRQYNLQLIDNEVQMKNSDEYFSYLK
ncbi:glycoside hydrolase family 73 protein [Tepidibacter hydrothermalis]|uniref:Glucosaminidase domain-containing protein n=1 Tax=Tepidibacter hydrothermalis TaxID=3036126 RepID=A0ABY8EE11_9FIRM|nr:glucosaminidase domain-containing protein [Tepidibacter hydrothermalis]WFD11183.1 glucosaminidase domain-containing protein [Tepidibacter hydrothermalis]